MCSVMYYHRSSCIIRLVLGPAHRRVRLRAPCTQHVATGAGRPSGALASLLSPGGHTSRAPDYRKPSFKVAKHAQPQFTKLLCSVPYVAWGGSAGIRMPFGPLVVTWGLSGFKNRSRHHVR